MSMLTSSMVVGSHAASDARLNIYRHQAVQGLTKALAEQTGVHHAW